MIRALTLAAALTASTAHAGGYVPMGAIPASYVFTAPAQPVPQFDANGVLMVGGAVVLLCVLFCDGSKDKPAVAPLPEPSPVPLPGPGGMLFTALCLLVLRGMWRMAGARDRGETKDAGWA